jgi:Skp family chaperone for outer membrane proteins
MEEAIRKTKKDFVALLRLQLVILLDTRIDLTKEVLVLNPLVIV